MSRSITLAERIGGYLRAKDGNRPHLLDEVFADDAVLEMSVRTDAIAFPALTHGRDAIADVLVRRFALQYENVYTLCIGAPPPATASRWTCPWLVVMTERDAGCLRLGCGRYEWSTDAALSPVSRLRIGIVRMDVLGSPAARPVLDWVPRLPYPWCGAATLRNSGPPGDVVRSLIEPLLAAQPAPDGG